MIRLIFACDHHDPCCDASFAHSFRASLRQSMVPGAVTIAHGCTDEERISKLKDTAFDIITDELDEKMYGVDIRTEGKYMRFVQCEPRADGEKDDKMDMEHCLMRTMAGPDPNAKPTAYVAIVTPSTVLEPTALEKMWLYLFVRRNVKSVRVLGYEESSLRKAVLSGDPMDVNISLPSVDPNVRQAVETLPLMYMDGHFRVPGLSKDTHPRVLWDALAKMMSGCRLLRHALYSTIDNAVHKIDIPVVRKKAPTLALHETLFENKDLLPQLWSEHAFYKWSARQEESEIYANSLESNEQKNGFDFWGMPFRKVRSDKNKPRVFFLMPWMQMGGSEKCMLDIAAKFVKMEWPVTFIFTMPFWHEDKMGEIALNHEWMDKALAITSDVFDIVQIAPNHKFSKVLRYLIETRSPDYVLTGNARVIYEHAKFIKSISPKTVIADYNHMVHMNWEVVPGMGGGMPRYGTAYTENFDLHLTASDNVTKSMKQWMNPDTLSAHPEKVKTCYIGTDPKVFHSGENKAVVRKEMRNDLEIADDSIVVLFAGRFVSDKGIDVMADVVQRVAEDPDMARKLTFLFVGSGDMKDVIETAQRKVHGKDPQVILQPPAVGMLQMRNYYAMSDIFLLPSNNEGIALVLYEAMAAGMLVMGTDVGGQKELVRTNTGVLLPNLNNPSGSASFIVRQLQAVTRFTPMFKDIQEAGTQDVRHRFTTEKFTDCVIDNMIRVKEELDNTKPPTAPQDKLIEAQRLDVAEIMRGERIHGMWNRKQAERSIEGQVTIGIKTYVCDASIVRQVLGLVRSIRVNYPAVRVMLANDGPTSIGDAPVIKNDPYTEEIRLPADSGISFGRNLMVNMTTTRYFVLLDDDHVFDEDTDLGVAVNGIGMDNFDVVGIRVRNLPGIEELEKISIFIPRYVAKVSKFENREVTLCVWNENNGPGVQSMRVPIRVDVLHNAMISKIDVLRAHPWRNILKVNEHMTFFLDARRAGVKVGYLPSVFVHHRARRYSLCYKSVRFREDKYEHLLEYKDDYQWDVPCGDNFPDAVRKHLNATRDV